MNTVTAQPCLLSDVGLMIGLARATEFDIGRTDKLNQELPIVLGKAAQRF